MIKLLIFIAICILCFWIYFKINYYKHCIEDLEANIVRIEKNKNEEMLNVLEDIKEAEDEAVILGTHDTKIRHIVSDNIDKCIRFRWTLQKRELEK